MGERQDKYLLEDESEKICSLEDCDNRNDFDDLNQGYFDYCCVGHSNENRELSEETKQLLSEIFSGEGNPRYGVELSEELKERISESNKEVWEDRGNPFKGETHTEETKERISREMEKCWDDPEKRQKMSEMKKQWWAEMDEEERREWFEEHRSMKGKSLEEIYGEERAKEIKQKISERQRQIPFEQLEDFEQYVQKVKKETRKWDIDKSNAEECYYCKKDLTDHPERKTVVDHKLSKMYGFENDINPEIIGNYMNLVVCCQTCNSRKNYRSEEQFAEYIKKNSFEEEYSTFLESV